MPQYVMPLTDHDAWNALSPFEKGYVECALFCGVERKEGDPLADSDKRYDAAFDEIDADTLAKMRKDCARFQRDARVLLADAYNRSDKYGPYDEVRAGHDFWYTRNGHGVGFWDRCCLNASGLGDRLSGVAKTFGEYSLFTADDDTVFGMEG